MFSTGFMLVLLLVFRLSAIILLLLLAFRLSLISEPLHIKVKYVDSLSIFVNLI